MIGFMGVLDLFLESECAVCARSGTALCRACAASIRATEAAHVDRDRTVFAAATYEGPVAQLVLAAKRSGHPRVVTLLAALATASVMAAVHSLRAFGVASTSDPLAGASSAGRIGLVPLHSGASTRRGAGCDLVALLARRAAKELRRQGVRIGVCDLLIPRPAHLSQKALNRRDRATNAANLFRVRRRGVTGARTLIIFDDVMTTGATVGAASLALATAGYPPARVAVVAYKPAPGHPLERS